MLQGIPTAQWQHSPSEGRWLRLLRLPCRAPDAAARDEKSGEGPTDAARPMLLQGGAEATGRGTRKAPSQMSPLPLRCRTSDAAAMDDRTKTWSPHHVECNRVPCQETIVHHERPRCTREVPGPWKALALALHCHASDVAAKGERESEEGQ